MRRQLPPPFDMDEVYPRDEENRYRPTPWDTAQESRARRDASASSASGSGTAGSGIPKRRTRATFVAPLSFQSDDDIWPRTPEFRFRIYACVGDERTILATSDCGAGVGLALITLHEDQRAIGRRLCDYGRIGVLDVMPGGKLSPRGEWVVQPYDRSPA